MAVLSDGTTWCWSLGPGPRCPSETGRAVKLRTLPCAEEVRTSYTDAIALVDGSVFAWGHVLGAAPRQLDALAASWVEAGQDVVAWGDTSDARIAGSPQEWLRDVETDGVPIPWAPLTNLAMGGGHACLIRDGAVYCVGRNDHGQLGVGSMLGNDVDIIGTPVRVDLPSRVVQVTAEASRTFAVDVDRKFWAWGGAPPRQEGAPPQGPTPQPWEDVSNLCQIDDGNGAACARGCSGEVHCWGSNLGGMIDATGDTSSRLPLTRINDLEPAAHVSVESELICSLKTDGTVWCRGFRATGGGLPFRGDAVQVFFDEDAR